MANATDGSMYRGNVSVTLSSAGAVILEGLSITRPTREVRQYDVNGNPLKRGQFDDFVTFSATAQYNGTKPAPGETFTYNAETFMVNSTGESHSDTDYDKCPISGTKKYN